MIDLKFLGAAETVTGSKYLLSVEGKKILVDCGLFQGLKHLRLKNWAPFSVDPKSIDAVVLTHAHLDHSGYLPLLVRNGYRGPIYCTHATKELCGLLLPDSGYLQEEEARYLNKHKRSKHTPALPLYSEDDATLSLSFLKGVDWAQSIQLGEGCSFEFNPAGHLLGAANITFQVGKRKIVFSGDVGRGVDPILKNAQLSLEADVLILESTYGNREHANDDPESLLAGIINETFNRGGVVLIPSFAIGRAQLMLYYIARLKKQKAIPDIPVYLNSPMASRANDIFQKFSSELKISPAEMNEVCNTAQVVASPEESMRLNEKRNEPMIIIAASGMATGGRVLHHLKTVLPDERNTILFVGFQAEGTRGEAMIHGVDKIKIHGEFWPVRAQVVNIDSLSAHADARELIAWVRSFKKQPKQIFLTHGEVTASEALKTRIHRELDVNVVIPKLDESAQFSP